MTGKKQEFRDKVGQVIQAETVTQIHHDQGPPLTDQERVELNNKVQRLQEEYGEPGWKTWKFLHSTIRVKNINEMCLGHRDSAHTIVDLMLERGALQKRNITQQSQRADSASELADLVLQNSTLSAKLDEAQAARELLRERLAAERVRIEQLARSEDGWRRRWHRGMLAAGLLFLPALAGLWWQAQQMEALIQQQNAQQARLSSLCELQGNFYRLGHQLEYSKGKDYRCVPSLNGAAQWQEIPDRTVSRRK